MCEIFAISSRHPVVANPRLREFFSHSVDHPHGWGLAWREDGGLRVHKEPLRAVDSIFLQGLLEEPIETAQLVGHIRNATKGVVSLENCHPFFVTDVTGATWVIAHNGTLIDDSLVAGYGARAAGQTDSERMALYLVDLLNTATLQNGGHLSFAGRFAVLEKAITSLSAMNKLNLVLDDGTYLYVHTNTLRDTLFSSTVGQSAFLCTVPLNDGGAWELVPHCRLIAYRDGQVVQASESHDHSFDDDDYMEWLGLSAPV